MSRIQQLIDLLHSRGPLPSATVQEALAISRPTLSRLMREVGDEVVRLGQTRRVRYAVPRRLPGLPETLPVAQVDADGRAATHAHIRPLQPEEWAWEPAAGSLRIGTGLPREVADLWPAGYMARCLGATGEETEAERLALMATRGEDLPGDLIVGEESLSRFLALDPQPQSMDALPELARQAEAGESPGGPVGGNWSKFTAWMENHQVLVKFARLDGDPADRRRADLLAAEATTLETLRQTGIDTPPARLIDRDGYRFLALSRFDRIGRLGRRPVVRLSAVAGRGIDPDDWPASARALQRSMRVTTIDADNILRLHLFGGFIGNDDRGGDNLAFFPREEDRLTLAPAYDMLPASLAPRPDDSRPDELPAPPTPLAGKLELWQEAARAAASFWQRLAADDRISFDFRKLAGARGKQIIDRLDRVGG